MNIKIAIPVPEDARGITTVLYKAWLVVYPNKTLGITIEDIEGVYKDAFLEESIQKREEQLRNTPPNQKKLVAKYNDKVVGIVTMVRNNNNNQLKTIYVLPEYQGKGIGTMLWNGIKDFIDPTKDTVVQVADYNEQAIRFYKKIGFTDTGKRWNDTNWNLKSGASIPEMELVLKK